MTGTAIHPDRILRELDELWVSLGREREHDNAMGVLRACAMTLVVLAREGREGPPVGEILAALMKEHPSRAIVVRVNDGRERRLDARVTAECWMPFGRQQQICCERIEIESTEAGLGDLPPVIRGLAAPDLPVVYWCRDLDLLALTELDPLFALAHKVILNSAGCPAPSRLFTRAAEIAGAGPLIADLSWTRLTRWRETIANVFECPSRRSELAQVRRVTVGHYGDKAPVRALYLYGWLRSALGAGPEYRLAPASGREPCQPSGEVQSVRVEGSSLDVSVRQIEGETVEMRTGDMLQTIVFPVLSEYDLLKEELSVEGRDTAFEGALTAAREFLGG